jgi:hypothetical protein
MSCYSALLRCLWKFQLSWTLQDAEDEESPLDAKKRRRLGECCACRSTCQTQTVLLLHHTACAALAYLVIGMSTVLLSALPQAHSAEGHRSL